MIDPLGTPIAQVMVYVPGFVGVNANVVVFPFSKP